MGLSDLVLPQRVRRGLVAYWPLVDRGVVDLKSALYNGRGPYDLTNNNSVTRGAGPSPNLPDAADFVTASSQSLSCPADPAFGGLDEFTIRLWMSVPTGANFRGASHDDGSAPVTNRSWGLLYFNSGATFRFDYSFDGETATALDLTSLTPSANTFYYLVARRHS